jgi:hypothetical protein
MPPFSGNRIGIDHPGLAPWADELRGVAATVTESPCQIFRAEGPPAVWSKKSRAIIQPANSGKANK